MRAFTPYPEINRLLERLLESVRLILDERLVGLYLHGSLAGGDFAPLRSDIDFVAVTTGVLDQEALDGLAAMHAALRTSGMPWADHLEGSYVPAAALRRYDPRNALFPALSVEGEFRLDGHGPDWPIQCWVLRERGITLAGPLPAELIEPISPDDLRRASLGVLHAWWEPQLDDPSRLRSREYQAYAALTMCRIRYTLANGEVATKPVAARWAIERIDPSWHGLIERALAWPAAPQDDALPETLDWIRETVKLNG